jgi:hypothetical protein
LGLNGFGLGVGQLGLDIGELGVQVVNLNAKDDDNNCENKAGREKPKERSRWFALILTRGCCFIHGDFGTETINYCKSSLFSLRKTRFGVR